MPFTPHRLLLIRSFLLFSPKPYTNPSSSSLPRLLLSSVPRSPLSVLTMPRNRRGKGVVRDQQWVEKPREPPLGDQMSRLTVSGTDANHSNSPTSTLQFGGVQIDTGAALKAQRAMWMPKGYSTTTAAGTSEAVAVSDAKRGSTEPAKRSAEAGSSSASFPGPLGAHFNVDSRTYARAQVRATFYPKFENEKSDQEIRMRMVEMVSHGLATLEVSLKHSGSLFMYSGHEGGAYAKNSFGNVYTAVGVFVLGRMFHEAWGNCAFKKQSEFNKFLEENHISISMELVTAVLGDHGQRPLLDYVVVTAVTELGKGKPKFYSTPEIIAFCRKWRLPTNHVWLFSTRKSVTSFFAAYDALCEEGTATPVCQALDEVADISVPGSKDHVKFQGEILEGLVARVVSPKSSKHLEEVLREFPMPPCEGDAKNLGANLREICAANRSDEKHQIKALLQSAGNAICPDDSDWFETGTVGAHSRNADRSILSKFLQSSPADYSTTKLQELIRLMRQRHFPAAFKCYTNFHKLNSLSNDNVHFKMVIHVFSDSVFRRYQQEMRRNHGLWPLYRGFFVDVNLFKVKDEKASEIVKGNNPLLQNGNDCLISSEGLADEDANLMIKLKFLTYKIRTFLIRNGLSILFKDGPSAYRTYYLRQMKNWGTSARKQRQLSKMLDEWAIYIRRKCGNKQLSASSYLTEAEPFLEQYAKHSLENQALIGSAGNFVRTEDFMAIVDRGIDEEGDLIQEGDVASPSRTPETVDTVPKSEGLIVFFPGIPGCAKSALCRELLNSPCGLGDERPMHSLMGDLIKGRYWQKVAEERKRKPCAVTLADKNAPNEEVWKQIEDMCRTTKASAVPVVPDSEGTHSNPFSLDALAVFIFRVLQRVNHPGNLDKASPNAGYVLLMFYDLYDGKSRREFENELSERFGTVVRMPLLKPDRKPLPEPLEDVLKEGLSLFRLHSNKHGRLEPNKGTYARDWSNWEKHLREVIFENAEYLNSIQVPFDFAVDSVREQLKAAARGEFSTPSAEKRKLGNIVFAAVTLPLEDIKKLLDKVVSSAAKVANFVESNNVQNTMKSSHVTLAHKRSHGVAAVANYGVFLDQKVPIEFTALLFSKSMAAFEVRVGPVNGEQIISRNEWPHLTVWTAQGVAPKEANTLPQLVDEGKGTRIEIDPPVTISGILNFH